MRDGCKNNNRLKNIGCFVLVIVLMILFLLVYQFYWGIRGLGGGLSLRYLIFPSLGEKIGGYTWSEEVKLSDGAVILVKRYKIGNGAAMVLKNFLRKKEKL